MATANLKFGIDLPVMQQLAIMPYSYNFHGSAFTTDGKRYIYWLPGYGNATFYRYDAWTDGWTQLASAPVAPSTSAFQSALAYDESMQRIWAVFGGSTSFYYFDVRAGAWSGALASLSESAGAGASLVHTCNQVVAAANDNYIYYFAANGSSLKLYRYAISTNAWSELGTNILPAAPSQGARLFWLSGVNADQLLVMQGAGQRMCYLYSISANSILGALVIKQSAGTLTTGSNACYAAERNELFWIEGGTRQINKVKVNLTGAQESGTATSGSDNQLIDAGKSWQVNQWAGFHVRTLTGTGAQQMRRIVSNTATALWVEPGWSENPASGCTYEILYPVFDSGSPTAITSATLSDSGKTWLTNAYANCQVWIVYGTGAGQTRFIASNTATQLTLTSAWTTQPDTNSVYAIVGYKNLTETQCLYSTSAYHYTNTMEALVLQGLLFVYCARANAQTDWFRWLVVSP
jgi:hypothetical protein